MTDTKTIAEQVAAYFRMSVPELKAEYEKLFGQPPHFGNRKWLAKNCAWRLQANAFGALPHEAQARLEQIIRDEIEPRYGNGATARTPRPKRDELHPGIVLTREWHGEQVRLVVTDDGFVVDGVPYASLSAAAFAVTGQRWNGRLFWGLTQRRTKEPAA